MDYESVITLTKAECFALTVLFFFRLTNLTAVRLRMMQWVVYYFSINKIIY